MVALEVMISSRAMAERRCFLLVRGDLFAELEWTRRAVEITQGRVGTAGKAESLVFKSEAEVLKCVEETTRQFEQQGYVQQPPGTTLRLSPTEEDAERILEQCGRLCALPDLRVAGGAPGASRLGGYPSLEDPSAWPRCGLCREPMTFLAELVASELSGLLEPLPFEGRLQIFACPNCDRPEHFTSGRCVRQIGLDAVVATTLPDEGPHWSRFMIPKRSIVGWRVARDTPDIDEVNQLCDHDIEEASELLAERGHRHRGEKVSGWPSWIQDIDYGECDVCPGTALVFVMQLAAAALAEESALYVLRCPSCGKLGSVRQVWG